MGPPRFGQLRSIKQIPEGVVEDAAVSQNIGCSISQCNRRCESPPFSISSNGGPILGRREESGWHIENPPIQSSQKQEHFLVCCPLCNQSAIIHGAPPPQRFVFTPAGLLFRKSPMRLPHTQLPQLPCQGFLIPSQRERAPPELIRILVCSLLFPSSHLLSHRHSFSLIVS